MSNKRPTVIFNGTPFQFYAFVKGLFIEAYVGLPDERLEYTCYTVAAKDQEEKPADPFLLGMPAHLSKFAPKTLKRVVSTEIEVVPDSNSSIVYLRFWSGNDPILERRFGWITAQALPNRHSKLILNFDYSIPLFKHFWDNVHAKLQTEGWIISQTIQPIGEPTTSNLDDWFDYRNRSNQRVSLRYIADKTRYAYGYVRRKNSEYMAEYGNKK
ncbi:MAG: hypothetical protein KIS80_07325 [Anaerolineales bacterium]|nr:hypothetical protein [Anaerolineales bacterium]